MRISDWSSDVCSSDLMAAHALARADGGEEADLVAAIVDAHFYAFDLRPVGARAEHRYQRQLQEAVRDRAADRLYPGLFLFHMYALFIAPRLSLLFFHILFHHPPFSLPHFLPLLSFPFLLSSFFFFFFFFFF